MMDYIIGYVIGSILICIGFYILNIDLNSAVQAVMFSWIICAIYCFGWEIFVVSHESTKIQDYMMWLFSPITVPFFMIMNHIPFWIIK